MLSITPRLIFEWFLKDIWKIILISILFAVIAVFYALSIPNQYSSSAKVSSNLSDSKSMGGALSSLGGLASLAGVSLGGGSMSPEVLKEMLNSSSFLASYIKHAAIEKEIMAAKTFESTTVEFTYDKKVYDIEKNKWVRDFKFPQTAIPSEIELVEKFKDSYSVNYDRKTKLISLSYNSLSPFFSKSVLDNLVLYFNTYMRDKDLLDSQSSIKYLKSELKIAKYNEVSLALQQILEEQYKKLALAKTREEYALRFIESPMVAAKKSSPKRALICLAITVIGTLCSILLLWSIRIFRN